MHLRALQNGPKAHGLESAQADIGHFLAVVSTARAAIATKRVHSLDSATSVPISLKSWVSYLHEQNQRHRNHCA